MRLINTLLLASALLLTVANIYLRPQPEVGRAKAAPRPFEQPPKILKHAAEIAEPIVPQPTLATAEIKWAPLEAEEYSHYIANLRAFGFPDGLIRTLIIAEMDALYEPRIGPLRTLAVPPDAPPAARDRQTNAEDLPRLREWQKLLIEKRERLEALLGGNVTREIIRTPISRNYDAVEFAVAQLPPEKQEAARRIIENHWIDGETLSAYPDQRRERGFANSTEQYSALYQLRDAGLLKHLTPDEFNRLMMNTMPAGTEMQREIVGMDPTDAELAGLYTIAEQAWTKNGGVYGKWRMQPVDPGQIRQNDREAEATIQELLGPERYADYRMARSDTGRQLNNMAQRYGMSADWARQAFGYQRELIDLKNAPPTPEIEARRLELRQGFQEKLGPILFEAWQRGQNLRFTVEP